MPFFEVSEESALSECVQILRDALHDNDFWPAIHAAEALTQAGYPQDVRNCLAGQLEQEPDMRRRCGLARELVRAGDRDKLADLTAVLADADPYGHVHACESLFKICEVGDPALLRGALQETAAPVKVMMAAAALSRQGDAAALALLREKLGGAERESDGIVAWILGILGHPEDLPRLRVELARADSPSWKASIEHALALLGDIPAQQALLENLHHSEAGIRAQAAVLAGEIGLLSAQGRLKELLADEHRDVQVRAAQGLLLLSRK